MVVDELVRSRTFARLEGGRTGRFCAVFHQRFTLITLL